MDNQSLDQNLNNTRPPDTSKSKTILLVEDDPVLVHMYQAKLENEGFSVLVALDGEIGLDYAKTKNIDLILLDVMVPKISGLDVLSQIKADNKVKDIPVIILTNLTQEGEQEKAKELGAVDYLVKANNTPSQVIDKINLNLK